MSLVACAREPTPRPEPTRGAEPDAASGDACLEAAAKLDAPNIGVARALCGDRRNLGVPGAAVVIARQGEVVLRFAAGVRCTGTSDPVSSQTAFRIGSLTKAITAATAHALADRGEIALDRPIGTEALAALGLSGALADGTIAHLLDHRAGLADHLPSEALRGQSRSQQLAALVGEPSTRPGERWQYANGGYALVGALLSRATGRTWAELVTREVLEPLAMADARTTADPRGDVACGHLVEQGTLAAFDVHADYERFAFGVDVAAPSGALLASVDDLATFGSALAGFGVQPAGIAAMRAAILEHAVATGDADDERYAAGMSIRRTASGTRIVRHAGATGDFWAELVWLVDQQTVVAVVANRGVPLAATVAAAIQRAGADPRR